MLQWSLFRHEDVVRVLPDHETFSNQVSELLSAPSGIDLPTHTKFRKIVEPFFRPEAIAAFEPKCRAIVRDLMDSRRCRQKYRNRCRHPPNHSEQLRSGETGRNTNSIELMLIPEGLQPLAGGCSAAEITG